MFCSAFLAATILPLGSEVVMVYLLAGRADPFGVIVAATTGNVLGSVVNYWMGRYGSEWLVRRMAGVSEADLDKARERFRTFGTASLLLAWVPVIGDPLTVAAGMLRIRMDLFLVLVTAGKLGRYLVLAGAVLAV